MVTRPSWFALCNPADCLLIQQGAALLTSDEQTRTSHGANDMKRRDFINVGVSGACVWALGCDDGPIGRDARPDGRLPQDDAGAGEDTGAPGSEGGLGSDGGQLASDGSVAATDGGEIGIVRPRIDPDGPTQFLTWDGGSGPNQAMWNQHLRLEWAHPGEGDWLDANLVSQGSKPWATVDVGDPGRLSVDVTPLVDRWIRNGENRGFFLRSDQAFPFYFVGRTGTPKAERPALEVTTDIGSFQAPCLANANWSKSTHKGFDTRERFEVNSGTSLAIVLLDLGDVQGTVQRATIKLTCDERKYPGVLSFFEADPPVFRVGGGAHAPQLGIADAYPLDQGLDKHPSVLFATDFADISSDEWVGTAAGATQVVDPATESTYLRGVFTTGNTGSCNLEHNLVRGNADGIVPEAEVERALYARYYVYLESDWGSTIDANKMPGWDTRLGWWNRAQGGYWAATTGNGGSRGTGLKVKDKQGRWEYQGHSIRGHGGKQADDGNYYDSLYWLGNYIYSLDQHGAFGESQAWPGTMIAKERWVCIEQYVQMNTISGPFDPLGNGSANFDGILRVWVDGVLSFERTNLRWTRHPELGLQGFWINWYHGGTQPVAKDMHYRMNSVVIAREYVGPRKPRA